MIHIFSGCIISMLIAFEKMGYESLIKIINKLLISVFGLVVLFKGFGLVYLVSVISICYLITLIIGIYLVYARISVFSFEFDFGFWKRVLYKSLPLALSGIFILFYFRIDIILISLLRGGNADAEIGWYS
ncbi:MAG: oligosaccharide flippase family protein, partial [Candidatus Dependentiae bacterium]|nr:oligosaccharide flippase family protein [Candidatus Dependentiae bacterium]